MKDVTGLYIAKAKVVKKAVFSANKRIKICCKKIKLNFYSGNPAPRNFYHEKKQFFRIE